MLVYAISIGLKQSEFWNMTLRQFRIEIKGHNRKLKEQDWQMWLLGQYFFSANLTATDSCLNGRKAKTEYVKKPFLQDAQLDAQTEEEKQDEEMKAAEKTFLKLKVMQANFELKKEREKREQAKASEENENKGGND